MTLLSITTSRESVYELGKALAGGRLITLIEPSALGEIGRPATAVVHLDDGTVIEVRDVVEIERRD